MFGFGILRRHSRTVPLIGFPRIASKVLNDRPAWEVGKHECACGDQLRPMLAFNFGLVWDAVEQRIGVGGQVPKAAMSSGSARRRRAT